MYEIDEQKALDNLDDALTATQRALVMALAQAPPDPIDSNNQMLHEGTRGLLIAHRVLDDEGYLTPFGVRAGLALADDDRVAAQLAAAEASRAAFAEPAGQFDSGPAEVVGPPRHDLVDEPVKRGGRSGRSVGRRRSVSRPARLTPTESTVLRLVSEGVPLAEVGQRLDISVRTAKVYYRAASRKAGRTQMKGTKPRAARSR